MDICFLLCICLWQISQIQTCLCVVVGPEFVSTSPAFMRSSANHAAGAHGRLVQKTVIGAPLVGAGGFDTMFTAVCDRSDSSTACGLCCSGPKTLTNQVHCQFYRKHYTIVTTRYRHILCRPQKRDATLTKWHIILRLMLIECHPAL